MKFRSILAAGLMALGLAGAAHADDGLDNPSRNPFYDGLKGKRVVFYFYPRDLTPGCTVEACNFQSDLSEYEKRNAVVIGVSTDDASSHQKFSDKHGLQFTLLTDADHETAESYGAWGEKNMYGRKIWGIKRSTFLIDEQGRISHVFEKVIPKEKIDPLFVQRGYLAEKELLFFVNLTSRFL